MCALLVNLPEFTGPLDLLFNLIQKRRLDVTELSLATVADQYLERVLALEGELDALSEFLLVASQLMLIKSRALLPPVAANDPAGDPAEELRRRLAEYQVLQAAARWLGERESEGLRSWPRGGELPALAASMPLAPLEPATLVRLLRHRLRPHSTDNSPRVLTTSTRPTLVERARVVLAAVSGNRWLPIHEVLGSDVSSAVATFLVVLVLARRGVLLVRQTDWASPLEIRRASTVAPEAADLRGLE